MPSDLLAIAPRTLLPNEPVTRSVVQVITVTYPADPPDEQVMRLAESSGALSFWDSPDEDIYEPGDGTPV